MISHTWTEREREFECMTDDNDDRDLKPEDDIRLTCKSHRRGAAVYIIICPQKQFIHTIQLSTLE